MKKMKIIFVILLLLITALVGYMKINNCKLNDIALKVLTWIKTVKGNAVDLSALNDKVTKVPDHSGWTALLQKHVSDAGMVDYKGFINDRDSLENYLDALSENPPGKNWTNEQKMAYWINAYNAFTIKLIVDHYPLKSIKDISSGLPMINSPWDIKFFKIGEVDFDLNTIEHEILRKQFDDNRFHFAINCASFSCPKLRNEAFDAEKLDRQLDNQTHVFINNPGKNRITANQTELSKIFDWFRSDFTKNGSVEAILKKHHAEFNEKHKIRYMEYDWSLNEKM